MLLRDALEVDPPGRYVSQASYSAPLSRTADSVAPRHHHSLAWGGDCRSAFAPCLMTMRVRFRGCRPQRLSVRRGASWSDVRTVGRRWCRDCREWSAPGRLRGRGMGGGHCTARALMVGASATDRGCRRLSRRFSSLSLQPPAPQRSWGCAGADSSKPTMRATLPRQHVERVTGIEPA